MRNRKGLRVFKSVDTGLNMEPIFTSFYTLYDTQILAIQHNDKQIRLNSGGWKTNHTKNCMNDNLPEGYRVFQKNFEWYVETPQGTLDFEDEMVITL